MAICVVYDKRKMNKRYQCCQTAAATTLPTNSNERLTKQNVCTKHRIQYTCPTRYSLLSLSFSISLLPSLSLSFSPSAHSTTKIWQRIILQTCIIDLLAKVNTFLVTSTRTIFVSQNDVFR